MAESYYQRLKSSDPMYSDYNYKWYPLRGSRSPNDFPAELGVSIDAFYKNYGIGINEDIGIFFLTSYATNDSYYSYYDANGKEKFSSYSGIVYRKVSPSLYYKIKLTEYSKDEQSYLRFGCGVDFFQIATWFHCYSVKQSEPTPFKNEYEKEYKDHSIGYHANIGIGYDKGLVAFLCTVNYTQVYFDSIKEKNGNDVMRYSDGRKVSSKIDMVTVNFGAGFHISL